MHSIIAHTNHYLLIIIIYCTVSITYLFTFQLFLVWIFLLYDNYEFYSLHAFYLFRTDQFSSEFAHPEPKKNIWRKRKIQFWEENKFVQHSTCVLHTVKHWKCVANTMQNKCKTKFYVDLKLVGIVDGIQFLFWSIFFFFVKMYVFASFMFLIWFAQCNFPKSFWYYYQF